MIRKLLVIVILFFSAISTLQCCAKPIKIYLWHSMVGQPGSALQQIIDGFNQSQQQYQVIGVYKGDYNETLTALVAAFRAKQEPAIVQVFEIGTATMMASPGAIMPVYKLMTQYGFAQDLQTLLPIIATYYSNNSGQLMAMPFNVSAPVLYYNKAAFERAGLNPNQPPATWPELANMGAKLLKVGYACAYTSAWPAWIQLETFSAWHNIAFATQANGFQGFNVRVLYDNPLVLYHLTILATWQKTHLFDYAGPEDGAQTLFTSGHCAMLTQSSGSRTDLETQCNFPVGVGTLPYWPEVKGAPQNAIIGGASLWVMANQSPIVYQGVVAFFHYLLQIKVQLNWQQQTGYLPLTMAAYQTSKMQGFYQRYPGSEIAIKELNNKPATLYSKGIRLGYFSQIREINNTAMEEIFSGKMSPKQALAYATVRANSLLVKFATIVQVSQQ
ncbi:MAG: hypothetical protein A3E87_01165 [Gammaproteobacteria bacterium RIFCSPHIGHO2_12_FULL_35_23]|nr:MAG: hypothetical protein A3E87_01165 [Gammaproteobacteria bacterium RIFCSPHIGHO2_12_FULL_35_23]